MLLLGITGTRGSGKGTVAQYVAEWAAEHGLLAVDRGFADKLKWAMARIFWPEISREDALKWANEFKNQEQGTVLIGDLEAETYHEFHRITGREFFQHGGTEMGRHIFGSDFWVDQLTPFGLDPATNFDGAAIGTVSDLRFENEARRIAQAGGVIWKVDRPDFEPDGHASEVPLDNHRIDRVVENDGSLETLRKRVFVFCDDLKSRDFIS